MTTRKLKAEVSTPEEDSEGDVWLTLNGEDRTANLNLGQPEEGLAESALAAAGLDQKADA